MSLLNFLKKFLFIQNLVSSFVASIHSYLDLTIGKYQAIKKAMFITAHDETYGSYIEFGIFTGSSFNFAMKINKKIESFFEIQNVIFLDLTLLMVLEKLKMRIIIHVFKIISFLLMRKKFKKTLKKIQKVKIIKLLKVFIMKR